MVAVWSAVRWKVLEGKNLALSGADTKNAENFRSIGVYE
jgi:hypothetical protein